MKSLSLGRLLSKMTKKLSLEKSEERSGGLILIGSGLLLIGIFTGKILFTPIYDTRNAIKTDGSLTNGESVVPVKVNLSVPSLNLKDLQDYDVSLDDYRGKVILINNWATWCPPCQAEIPTLESYYQAHKDEGFVIIGIEAGDPPADVEEFVRDYKITFPIWLDLDNKALQAFKNFGLPNSYVINKDFIVQLAWTGIVSDEMLERFVTPIIQE